MTTLKVFILFLFGVFIVIPLLFYGIQDLIRTINRTHIKGEFYIEYLEMNSSVSLWNSAQSFVGEVTEAYWNNDSLVVSGRDGCFLVIFGITKYNDEMIQIDCDRLRTTLIKKPIERYISK